MSGSSKHNTDLPSGSRKFNCPLIDHYDVVKSNAIWPHKDEMEEKKDSPWFLFYFQLLKNLTTKTWHRKSHIKTTPSFCSLIFDSSFDKRSSIQISLLMAIQMIGISLSPTREAKALYFSLFEKSCFQSYWQLFYILRLVDKQPSHHRWVLFIYSNYFDHYHPNFTF